MFKYLDEYKGALIVNDVLYNSVDDARTALETFDGELHLKITPSLRNSVVDAQRGYIPYSRAAILKQIIKDQK